MNDWPDPLRFADGRMVERASDWPARRAELLRLFEEQMYGPAPAVSPIAVEVEREETRWRGAGTLRTLRLHTGALGAITVAHALPRRSERPAPTLIGLSFDGPTKALAGTSWPVEKALRRGWGVAFAHYEELAPDRLPKGAAHDSPITGADCAPSRSGPGE